MIEHFTVVKLMGILGITKKKEPFDYMENDRNTRDGFFSLKIASKMLLVIIITICYLLMHNK